MSRNHRKNLKAARRRGQPKVTATVTGAQPGDVNAAPQAAVPAQPIPLEAAMKAMDFASKVGENIGHIAGFDEGFHQGKMAPRTAGEQRVRVQAPAAALVLNEVFAEIKKAIKGHGPMHSGHEGFAVIREELDELWDEVKADRGKQASARTEAIQVAAMAVRYVLDLDPR
jgi:hypothetical protein